MSKKLVELFNRFETDDGSYSKILNECTVKNVRINKELKYVEADVESPELIDKRTLYSLEEALRQCYFLTSVRIKPVYPSE